MTYKTIKFREVLYRTNQKGRSMIEMLGVLAIIGILTVIGVIGFNRALENYRSNKIKDQLSYIKQNIQELQNKQITLHDLSDISTAVALGIFPEEMVQRMDGKQIVRHAGGGPVKLITEDGRIYIVFEGLLSKTTIDIATKSEWDARDKLINQNIGE